MGNKKHLKSVICLLLTMLMVFSVVFVANAAEDDVAQTGATTTVYFRNTENWSTVNAYVWVKGTSTSVKVWPGEAMTLHEGNIYKYTVNGDYNMIIFNNGNGTQTGDLDLGQDGYLYDYSTKAWEKYADPTPTLPTTETQETEEPKPTTPPESKIVFFNNTAGWSSVNAYMWKDGAGNNKAWPGVAMTNIGEDIWQYEVTGDFDMIIFNNGSTQTGNLSFPGSGYIYDYASGKWDIYDTSAITVKSTGTDLKSPQYKDTEITLSANATSTEGTVYYKFSVTNGGTTTVLSDFSAVSSVKWTPSAVGTYTLTYDFKDAKGNENQRTATYVIEDDTILSKPVIKKVTPGTDTQVKYGEAMNITVTAGGGKIGTKLLFYKYTVKDASGKVLNVPHYTKKANYSYTPKALGKFTVTVSVQNAFNDVVERTYTYESVENPEIPTIPSDQPSTNPNPSGVLGDADNDGVLSVMDATQIQRYGAQLITSSDIRLDLSDFDEDGVVSVMDATAIQQKLAALN